jgi:hypothetical protein
MRTAIIIICGIVIWAVSLVLANRLGKPGGTAVADATLAFITFWLLAMATSMWIGAAEAHYTIRQALPIFALSFGIPAAIAALVKWKFF